MLQRDSACGRQQRQAEMGSLALVLSQISAPDFPEWALHSVAYSRWAREYYDEQRAKGKRRNTVIRSLAFKWIRILFSMLERRRSLQRNHL